MHTGTPVVDSLSQTGGRYCRVPRAGYLVQKCFIQFPPKRGGSTVRRRTPYNDVPRRVLTFPKYFSHPRIMIPAD